MHGNKQQKKIAIISHSDCLKHFMGEAHPERPARIEAIHKALLNSQIKNSLDFFEAPLANEEELFSVHQKKYVQQIQNLAPTSGYVVLDPDTIMNPHTYLAALRAAGAVIYAVDLVMTSAIKLAFCNIRPPGHHAEYSSAMGFCFFNNIAVGVAHALNKYHLKRIAIIDFDVHHGNGTEDIFMHEDRVFLFSSFQHPFYPLKGSNTQSNHIFNLPLPAGTTGQTFKEAIEKQWFLKLEEIKPELIFFSAGFDAHKEDALANFLLEEEDYAWLTKQILKIANNYSQGRMISVLEGGYALSALGRSVVAHLKAML